MCRGYEIEGKKRFDFSGAKSLKGVEAAIEVLCIKVVVEKEFPSVLYVRLGNQRRISTFTGLRGEIYGRMKMVKYDSLHRVWRMKRPFGGIVNTDSR